MKNIQLRLNDDQNPGGQQTTPVMGLFAVGFGLLGIFGPALVFVPLTFITAIIAIIMGQGVWGFIALLLGIAGVLSSPLLLGMIGLGYFINFFDFSAMMQPVWDIFNSV